MGLKPTVPPSQEQRVLVDSVAEATVITINREHRRNAFDTQTVDELLTAFSREAARNTRVVILTGAGTAAFCAGGDIKAYAAMTPAQRLVQTDRGQELLEAMQAHPSVVVGAVEGYCLGGGLELALGCDLRIAGAGATFGLPEIGLSALPSVGGHRLARYVGIGRALEMILFSRRLDATTACSWGLVAEVVKAGTALARARELAEGPLAELDRSTITRAKALVHRGWDASDRTGRYVAYLLDELQTSSEVFESGVSAFGGGG